MLNTVTLMGKLANFDSTFKPEADGKNAFLAWFLNVKRDYKKEDEKFYPTDLIPFKAFGKKAEFINKNFNKGDAIVLQGRLEKDNDYEKDGQVVRGGLYLNVKEVMFVERTSEDQGSKQETTTTTKPVENNPLKNKIAGNNPLKNKTAPSWIKKQ